jgi:imidazolonepropionase-like amidohydrolase
MTKVRGEELNLYDQIIYNVTIVDVSAGITVPKQTLVISGGRIEEIITGGDSFSVPMIDASGLFVTPGLIDSHVHVFFNGSPDPLRTYLRNDREENLRIGTQNATLAIKAGITSMRDLGGPLDLLSILQESIERGKTLGPHIIHSGAPLTRPGGHCHFFGGEVSSIKEAQTLIEKQAMEGAQVVKLMASGGGMTAGTRPHEADLSLELMNAAREVAHSNGMTITAHCHATEAIQRSIEAQLDMIEHVGFLEPTGRVRYDEETAIRIRRKGIVVCPTAANGLRTARLFRKQGSAHTLEDIAAVERLEARISFTRMFHDLGLKIIGGSDCGDTVTPFNTLIEEIEAFISVGFSNAEALRSVTTESAKYLQLAQTGDVKAGYQADLILLRSNPLLDIGSLRHPVLVLKSGEIVHDAR